MEIGLIVLVLIVRSLFKIDLIVWKYSNSGRKYPTYAGFKIDLIVWKYSG